MTFNGADIFGQSGGSVVRVTPAPVERDDVRYGIQGIPGTFRHNLGTRSRPIAVAGTLKSASSAAMNDLESSIEAVVKAGTEAVLVDDWSRSFDNCVLDAYERKGPRRQGEDGACYQEFTAKFVQLVL